MGARKRTCVIQKAASDRNESHDGFVAPTSTRVDDSGNPNSGVQSIGKFGVMTPFNAIMYITDKARNIRETHAEAF